MKHPTFSLRDLLWLILAVGIGLGWWMDQDRIRRESEALKATALRLQSLPVKEAETKLRVTDAELTSMNEINQKNPGVISASELQRVALQLDVAKTDLEKARARVKYGP
jgi:multidrug resistance efflux pump